MGQGSSCTTISKELPVHKIVLPLTLATATATTTTSRGELDSTSTSSSPYFSSSKTKTDISLIILNSPIHDPLHNPIFQTLWDQSTIRICADGGANRLYEATVLSSTLGTNADQGEGGEEDNNNNNNNNNSVRTTHFIPDLIRGDLDSLRPDVRDYYESRGCRVECDPDQNSNDLDKAMQAICNIQKNVEKEEGGEGDGSNGDGDDDHGDGTGPYDNVLVYVYGAFGGRFDQEMASIQALYKWGKTFQYNMFLYNNETCAMLLPPSYRNEVRLADNWKHGTEGPNCGLIPIGCRCDSVITSGLKWNLDAQSLEFGGLVSTSNRIIEDTVVVHTSQPLIFTAEISALQID